jgi:HD-like signal output (HDOD) protein
MVPVARSTHRTQGFRRLADAWDGGTPPFREIGAAAMSIVTTSPNPNRVRDLERALEDVRASRPAAAHVLAVTDDPHSDAGAVAVAIEADPMLTAQVLRLANSAAFGMSERVSSTQVAVSLVGQSAIRSIAVLLASGLRNHKNPVPAGFWSHSASTAAACAVLSSRFGVVRGEAFSLGLLHDVGSAILHSVDPATHAALVDADDDTTTLCIQELLEFGMSHADAAARVLSAWNFPAPFVTAVAHHHDAGRGTTPFDQVLLAGDAVAHVLAAEDQGEPDDLGRLGDLGIDPEELPALRRSVADYAAEAMAALPL